jgi:urate oxidase
MKIQFRLASREQRLGVLNAHPDLAGKLAAANRLTAESTNEQASAGLDSLTDEERATFTSLNSQYTEKFGFPFIIAVKGLTKAHILEAFKTRINNDRDTEFSPACLQVEKIALLRLKDYCHDHQTHTHIFQARRWPATANGAHGRTRGVYGRLCRSARKHDE